MSCSDLILPVLCSLLPPVSSSVSSIGAQESRPSSSSWISVPSDSPICSFSQESIWVPFARLGCCRFGQRAEWSKILLDGSSVWGVLRLNRVPPLWVVGVEANAQAGEIVKFGAVMDIIERVISAFLWLILVSRVLPKVAGNAEGDALNALKNNLADPNNVLQSWDPTLVNPCTWFHVTCNSDNSVTRVELYSNNITGRIPEELGNLTNLASQQQQPHRNNSHIFDDCDYIASPRRRILKSIWDKLRDSRYVNCKLRRITSATKIFLVGEDL
ncbi:hypothetical protein CRG98_041767, partial [Punica granatum]